MKIKTIKKNSLLKIKTFNKIIKKKEINKIIN